MRTKELHAAVKASFRLDRFKMIMDAIRANPQGWYQGCWHTYAISKEEFEEMVRGGKEEAQLYTRDRAGPNNDLIIYIRSMEKGECGTAHCVAGWAQIHAGLEQDAERAAADGGNWLGLPVTGAYGEGCWLFGGCRTWEQLVAVEEGRVNPVNGWEYSWSEHP